MRRWTDRRGFLKSLGAAAGYTAGALGYPANETVTIGCIGTGGRCRALMRALAGIPGVKVVAVCDVWDVHLAMGRELAGAQAFATRHYPDLLARKDIDAVVIASPDHWHVPMTVDACRAGKDVYVEKPLTHRIAEGEAVVRAQNEHRRIVQVGMQQRSMPHIRKAFEIVKSGRLGSIHKVHLTWNRNQPRQRRSGPEIDPATVDWQRFLGNAPAQPFDAYRFRNWRWFWDFGGGIFTDLMVHWVDVAYWFLDLGRPMTASSTGGHYMAEGLWETPDTVQTLLDYPGRKAQVYFEGTFVNARNAAMIEFMGTEASLYIDRGRWEIHPERGRPIPYEEMVLGEGPRGADFYKNPDGEVLHLAHWLDCVRARRKPNTPAEEGVRSAEAAHLANQALRSGSVARIAG